jgi:hypothetical protein
VALHAHMAVLHRGKFQQRACHEVHMTPRRA